MASTIFAQGRLRTTLLKTPHDPTTTNNTQDSQKLQRNGEREKDGEEERRERSGVRK